MATWVATKSAGIADAGKHYTDTTRQVLEAVRNTIGNIHPLIRNVPVLKTADIPANPTSTTSATPRPISATASILPRTSFNTGTLRISG